MYLAKRRIKGKLNYFLKESFQDGDSWRSRVLFDLGVDPARYIVYPGGNAFYIDEVVEEKLRSFGIRAANDEIEDVFWPFLKPRIRHVLEPFRQRARAKKKKLPFSTEEEKKIQTDIHAFDKRRIHYLRFGEIEQGKIELMPARLFRQLLGKSRDELEQHFMQLEQFLPRSELKTYVYVIFDLQRFFSELIAKKMPQGLDQKKVDQHFFKELCLLNNDKSFWTEEEPGNFLHEYLVRYAIMFVDNEFGKTPFWDEYTRNFHSRSRPVQAKESSVTFDEACAILGIKKEATTTITKHGLLKLYRHLAKKLHPDKGGEHEKFIKLTEAYQTLVQKTSQRNRPVS
ncbi:MAG: DnaJ domain-containing protein [Deltaproteobacteria bacterium]|nr:DnaJ domain-containing protein [Deltaproteobacteria bacterium]